MRWNSSMVLKPLAHTQILGSIPAQSNSKNHELIVEISRHKLNLIVIVFLETIFLIKQKKETSDDADSAHKLKWTPQEHDKDTKKKLHSN